jgi:P4 family phage/plasmid primase-like protien
MSTTKGNIYSSNHWADFWHYKIGINIFPLDKDKATYENWSQHQGEVVPDKIHEEWKRKGRYAKGIILMPGKVWRGENKGLYFVGIDFDKELGIKEFSNIVVSNTFSSIDELRQKFIVEQHKVVGQQDEDDPNSYHVYFYSEIPFTDKSSDSILGIEIKSNNKGLMCATPSYNYETKSRWQIKGIDSPLILKSEDALKLMNSINDICRKYNIQYLEQSNNKNNSSKLPDELRKLVLLLEIPKDFQYRILEGSRHNTLLSFANSLLFTSRFDINANRKEELKNFFYEVNDKICDPPLPENEIKKIWIDSLKCSEEKSSRIKIENDDENDPSSYKSQLIIPLEYDDQLLETVQTFVYDIQKNSIDIQLNSKYKPGTRLVVPINIKQWPDVKKSLKNQCIEKEIDEPDTLSLLEAFDNNLDKITKHYLENNRKSNAALAAVAAEQRKRLRQQLIMDGTEFLMAKYRFATIEKINDILVYNNEKGVYDYGGEIIIGKEIEKKYGYQVTTGIVNEIRDHIIRKTGTTKDKFDSDLDIINVKNGLLNMKTRKPLPHTPDYLSLNQLPIKYNSEAKAPKYLKFLNDVLYPDQIRTANEIVAYTFIRKNLFQYWVVLIGNGGNGKNVFIGIITGLHGKKNVSNVPLAHLGNLNLRFATSQLENKNVNFDTELSTKSYNDLSTLKKFTDTQPIPIERKGKDPYDIESWAKQILSCNKLPPSSDDSDARFRRELLLPFPFQFVEEKDEEQQNDPNIRIADPFLLDEIIDDEEEMSGILNIVLDSLESIYENKKIYTNSTINQRRVRAELIADPVKAFYNENCEVPSDPAGYEIKEDLYKKFLEFCKSKKSQIVSSRKFFKQLKEEYNANEGRVIIKDKDGKDYNPRVLFNIHLLTDEEKKKRDDERCC